MGKLIDLTGQKFGRLTATKCVGRNKHRDCLWECKCECGEITTVTAHNLINGLSKSCGCYRSETTAAKNTIHNLRYSKLYTVFYGMKKRCYYCKAINYKYYGGCGITICDEWRNNFQAFYDWAIDNGYADGLTIDRIDVNGNYEPSNCRWVTMAEQNKNKRGKRNYEKSKNKRITV